MTLVFTDGFDSGDHASLWANSNGTPNRSLQTGRFGSAQSLRVGSPNGNQMGLRRELPLANTLYMGGACKMATSGTSETMLMHFGGFGSFANIGLWASETGGLSAWRHSSSQLYLTAGGTGLESASEGLRVGEWCYLEMRVTVNATTGRVVVRKNGRIVIDFTGNTQSSTRVVGTDFIILGGSASSSNHTTWDDVYVLNDAGSTNNDFLGDVSVEGILPNANGTYSDFTGSDGNSTDNYLLVDDASMTDYVASSTVTQRDSYGIANTSKDLVHGVQVNTIAQQANAGSASVRQFVRTGGSNYNGGSQYLGQMTTASYAYDENPNTTAAWTTAEVNGLEAGVETI